MPHGSISKIGKNYRVCFDFGKDENGKRTRKYKTFKTKKEAEIQLARHDVAMEDGYIVRPKDITLGDWLDYWMEHMYAPRSAETTVYSYNLMIDNHIKPSLGNHSLQKLKPATIQQYYTYLMKTKGLSPNTVLKHHDLLNTTLKAAVKHEYILRNPIEGVDRPKKIIHEAKVYTPAQLQKLLVLCEDDRLEVVIKLGAYLGLRREEICGLQWDDIDWDSSTLFVRRARTQVGTNIVVKETKTYASNRKLYMPDDLIVALRKEQTKQQKQKDILGEIYETSPYIAVMDGGKPYRPNYVSELFTKFLKKNDMPKIVLHELRHTFASISNDAGVQEFNIGKALGHANVSTTKKIYTHLFDDKHTKAVNAVADMLGGELNN